MIGILGAYTVPPIISAVSDAIHTANARALPIQPEQMEYPTQNDEVPKDVEVKNVKFLSLLDQEPSFDPVCGNDRHQAKAAGCHYDLLATRWFTADCYNPDVLQEFLDETDFDVFFEDPGLTRLASRELVLSGDWDLLWHIHDFHIMHCLYQWRRLHKAVLEHRSIDEEVFSYGHTLHCTRLIMNWPNEVRYGKNTTTIIGSRTSYCLPGTAASQPKA